MSRPDPVSIRLPEALKASMQQAADAAGRSLNAEIRMRLEWSLEAGFAGTPSDRMLANEIESLRAELRSGIANLNEDAGSKTSQIAEIEKRLAVLEAAVSPTAAAAENDTASMMLLKKTNRPNKS
jgi:hypothetical protein